MASAQAASRPEPASRHRSQPSSKPAAIMLRLTYNNRAADLAREAQVPSEPVIEPGRRQTRLKITYRNWEVDYAAVAAQAPKAIKAEEADSTIAP
ncbi:hypothetical protein A9Z42_0033150 [Trichoderma parareesei]|uniref:Uncharacterized protein n=1 Tax=Trichoderma parareesei TaxID=858221 RepID=A0A2H2ZUD7_TRIPA|nr:hypothetical protein A9Z42_0033150 [Trichoderma parareesei]